MSNSTAQVATDTINVGDKTDKFDERNLEKEELNALFKLVDERESSDTSGKELQLLLDLAGLKDCSLLDVNSIQPETLLAEIHKTKKYICDYEDLSATFVLRGASQGIITIGTTLCECTKLHKRQTPIVQINSNVCLRKSRLTPFVFDREFFSRGVLEEFERNADILGISAAKILADTEKQNTIDSDSENFYCRILWFVIPFISWQPLLENFSFSNQALKALFHIENLLQQKQVNEAKQQCQNFFRQFGSHVNFGKVQLGGIFKIKAIYTGSSSNKCSKNVVQTILSSKLKHKFILDYVLSTNDAKDNELLDDTGKEVQIHQSQIGGPTEVSCIPLWRRATAANNRSWAVVDRGKHNVLEHVGIWTLVKNQSAPFIDHASLSKLLSDEWLQFAKGNIQHCAEVLEIEESLQNKLINLSFTSSDIFRSLEELLHTFKKHEMTFGCSYLKGNNYHSCKGFEDLINYIPTLQFSQNELIEIRENIIRLLYLCKGDYKSHDGKLVGWLRKYEIAHERLLISKKFKSVEEFLKGLDSHFMKSVRLVNRYPMDEMQSKYDLNRSIESELPEVFRDLFDVLSTDHKKDEFVLLASYAVLVDFDTENNILETPSTPESLDEFLQISQQRFAKFQKLEIKYRLPWCLKNIIINIMEKNEKNAIQLKKYSKIIDFLRKHHVTDDLQIAIFPCERRNLDDILISLNKIVPISWECLPTELNAAAIENSNTLSVCKDNHRPLSDLLKLFGMDSYFPEKLSKEKALVLNDNMFSEPKEMKDVPFAIIRKIISTNYTFREKVIEEFLQKSHGTGQKSHATEQKSDATEQDIKQRTLLSSVVRSRKNMSSFPNCHPQDVCLAIFICCDPFLKRILAQKISICQMALPIIYTDYTRNELTLSIWPLRDIYLDGETESVVTQDLKTISFIRIGNKPFKSKSKLINSFLRENVHDTFYHCDCALGQQKRTISEGLVEVSWFVPNLKDCGSNHQEKKSEHCETINIPLTVFNLRGDASNYETQLELLLLMSNILILLMKFEEMSNKKYLRLLSKIHRSGVTVVFMTNLPNDETQVQSFLDDYSNITKMDESKTRFISTTDLNEREIRQELIKELALSLNTSNDTFVIENIQMQIPSGMQVNVDEHNSKCMKAKQMLEDTGLEKELQTRSEKRTTLKDKLLPVQGETFWQEWSKMKKKYCRASGRETYPLNDPHRRAMKICRIRQVEICNNALPVMANFVIFLVENIKDEILVKYFITWVEELLNKRTKTVLPILRLEYNEAFSRYVSLRQHLKENMANYEQTKKDIENAEKIISQTSVGIEHLFREIGQIYEAFMDCSADMKTIVTHNTMQFLHRLPNIVAKLLLMGQPLEIMDGEAANIPQRWIHSVFSELSVLVGNDKKVFTVSVVGIQSSGKSTLLNTMFGLQFPVSAGRCSRGLFLQLLPVDKKQSSLQFNYVMIIDTEGLRAPEILDQRIDHDNKLATLAIGLGDVAIVNVKGEVFADMEDILQIVVHAIVRLKHAKGLAYHQSSVFVHQNVSCPEATGKIIHGKLKLVQNLDEKARIVAEEENMADITSFCDVIDFDSSKHVKYICDLWQGSPPGAPANDRYTNDVTNVAKVILYDIASEKHTFLTISETEIHIRNIWDGILSDNFVFSFRNTLEVKAFSSIEDKYQKLAWQLSEFKLQWLNIQVFPEFSECKTEADIEKCYLRLKNAFDDEFDKLTVCVRRELEQFFDKSDLKDYMIHWKESKISHLNTTSNAIKMETQEKIDMEKKRCIVHMEKRNQLWENKKRFTKHAVDLANAFLGNKLTPSAIDKEFEKMWTKLLDIYAPEVEETQDEKFEKNRHLKNQMKQTLQEFFLKHQKLLEEELSVDLDDKTYSLKQQLQNSLTLENVHSDHINTQAVKQFKENKIRQGFVDYFTNHKNQALRVVNDIFTRCDKLCEDFLQSGDAYDRTHFMELLNAIMKKVDEHNKDSSRHGYKLTTKFHIYVSLHVSRHAFKIFQVMNEKNKKKKSLRTLLHSDKDEIRTLFVGVCWAKEKEVLATDLICSGLRQAIKREIIRSIAYIIPGIITRLLRRRKAFLVGAIIRDLIENESFEDFIAYLRHSDMYAYIWMLKFTKKFFSDTEKSEYKQFMEYLNKILSIAFENVRKALQYIKTNNPPSKELWVQCFFKGYERRPKLSLSFESFLSLDDFSSCELQEMQSNIEKQLCEIESEILIYIKDLSLEEIEWEMSPFLETFNFLWGCKNLCPLCEEPCIVSTPHDSHECLHHRPSGLVGIAMTESDKLVCETCEFNIQSTKKMTCGAWCNCQIQNCSYRHHLKKFNKIIRNWVIHPSKNASSAKYWAWLMTKYRDKLAQHYDKVVPDIPEEWNSISKADALANLDEMTFLNVSVLMDTPTDYMAERLRLLSV